jgi:chaperone required for assembly of F1-ATPase
MGYLPETGLTEKIYLPTTIDLPEDQREWVIMKDRLSFGDTDLMYEAESEFGKRVGALARIISDWSFLTDTYDEGTKSVRTTQLPITVENIRALEAADVNHLATYLYRYIGMSRQPLSTEQKKTPSATLTPLSTNGSATSNP